MPCVDVLKAGLRAAALAACCLALAARGGAAEAEPPARPKMLDRPAQQRPQAAHQLLLAAAQAGKRLVAVGAAGAVVLSDDAGVTWRQARAVPTSATLTGVAFANERDGYAIGHLGIVLRSRDGGDSWIRVLDGMQAAALSLAAAEARVAQDDSKSHQMQRKLAQLAVADGPNKPLLVLKVDGPDRALVLGAFGLALETSDGGQHWRALLDRFDNPAGSHYYGLARSDGASVVVGEQGLLLRSTNGTGFKATASPYPGTLFGVVNDGAGHLLAYGLRGTVLRSTDQGASWARVDAQASTSFQAGTVLPGGTIVLGNEIGLLMVSRDGGQSFKPLARRVQPAADLLALGPQQLLVVGPRGAERVDLTAQDIQ